MALPCSLHAARDLRLELARDLRRFGQEGHVGDYVAPESLSIGERTFLRDAGSHAMRNAATGSRVPLPTTP